MKSTVFTYYEVEVQFKCETNLVLAVVVDTTVVIVVMVGRLFFPCHFFMPKASFDKVPVKMKIVTVTKE